MTNSDDLDAAVSTCDFSDGVFRLDACRLVVADRDWSFQRVNSTAIVRNFRAAFEQKPDYFNGRIFVLTKAQMKGRVLDGVLAPTDFASYLYWRETGFDVSQGRDLFGKAIIETADRALLLGRAAPHTMNAGYADLIGGFIDPIDVGYDGKVDIVASIEREVNEEIGLVPEELQRQPGFIVSVAGALVALVVHFRTELTSAEHVTRIADGLGKQCKPELTGVVVIEPELRTNRAALEALHVPAYAVPLIGALTLD